MLSVKKISLILFFISSQFFSQKIKYELFPEGQNFMPLKASHQEARMGILYYPENGYLKVDIGNSSDLFAISFRENDKLTLAIDFMAYALSTNYSEKRLQIAVLDGFFGGHGAYRLSFEDRNILLRFRIIHNSAHFVDGLWDVAKDDWIGEDRPIPFTQDFGELTVADEHILDFGSIKYYSSVAYATMVRPAELEKWSFNAGIEINSDKVFGMFLQKPVNLFFASHNVFAGKPEYKLSSNNLLGIKFGEWYGKGLTLYFSYYNGNHKFSEYYFKRVNQFGAGFSVDFF
ncbi:MAG: hypothetical protein COW71_00600 [Ignavibacteriales bacterium CG18_big_fil_WC_8_21_14_2_50_31_20]|nr:MAG: hypothetical protein COW71_00600 [Ignavibacteriales bacterium CG18_big_fil_WC_8_21_14_2_50_31_20]